MSDERKRPTISDVWDAVKLRTMAALSGRSVKELSAFFPLSYWSSGADTRIAGLMTSKPYAAHAVIYRAVNLLARNAARPKAEVFQAEGDDKIEGHWLPGLLSTPGGGRYGTQLRQAMVISLKLRGECFLWHRDIARAGGALTPGSLQRPTEVWLLSPLNMAPADRLNGRIVAWNWTGSTTMSARTIPIEELTFLKYENPYDEDRGLGPVQAGIIEYTGDIKAAMWNESFFDNSAIPPVVFKPGDQRTWDEKDRTRFLADWNAKYQGTSKRGRAAALPQKIDIEVLKYSHAEMEHLSGRKYSREMLAIALGTPPGVLGIMEYANYANLVQQQKQLWQDTLIPDLVDLEDGITYSFLDRYDPGHRLRFNVDPILAEIMADDFAKKVETGSKLWAMGWPAADVNDRLAMGLPTNGLPHLLEGFLPHNVSLASDVTDPDEPEDDPKDPPPFGEDQEDPIEVEEEDGDEAIEELENKVAQLEDLVRKVQAAPSKVAVAITTDPTGPAISLVADPVAAIKAEEESDGYYSQLTRSWRSIARTLNRTLRSWLWARRRYVLAQLAKNVSIDADGTIVSADLDAIVWDEAEGRKSYWAKAKPSITLALQRGGEKLFDEMKGAGPDVAKEIDDAIEFDWLDPEVQILLGAKEVKLMEKADDIRNIVRAAVGQGIEEGDSVVAMGKRIRNVFDIQRSRSLTIARTETAQSFSGGRYEGMKQRGVKYIRWVTSNDDRVRETHLAMSGHKVKLGERFPNGLLYPGDWTTPKPEEVVNCRCQSKPERK